MNIILIPAYQPNQSLITFVENLISLSIKNIVVIDDGSGPDYDFIFKDLKEKGCYLVQHEQNLGKGAAIKSGIIQANQLYEGIKTYITCDADGQHLPSDVYRMMEFSELHPDALVLGVRDFKKPGIPFRNKIGNFFSSIYFYLSTGKNCPDTQTGLRSIPHILTDDALSIQEKRYDYEMAFLLKEVRANTELLYIPIETIYIDQNENSHFRPIKDSILIYKQPLKFAFASLTSAVIDLGIFSLLIFLLSNSILEKVAIASIVARLISGVYNFLMNRMWSFRSKHNIKHQFAKYGVLYIGQLATSILLVSWLSYAFGKLVILKFIVDTVLFVISYQIQKRWVFKKIVKETVV